MGNSEHLNFAKEKTKQLVDEWTKVRTQNFISQRDVARILSLSSHGNIALIERHKSIPTLTRFLELLSVFGLTLKITRKADDDGGEERDDHKSKDPEGTQ